LGSDNRKGWGRGKIRTRRQKMFPVSIKGGTSEKKVWGRDQGEKVKRFISLTLLERGPLRGTADGKEPRTWG